MQTETLIIGGGLSGLYLASQLAEQDHEFLLVEARNRLGGRILSEQIGTARFDLGPAWFWPGQPRIGALIERFKLTQFDQYSEGELSFEDERGIVRRGLGFASLQGSFRLQGGLAALSERMSSTLDANRIRLNSPIVSLTRTDKGIEARTQTDEIILTRDCILTLPPRIAADLTFAPNLPEPTTHAMKAIPTWMAGQAKAVAVYDNPFWRQNGLSGDAMSRLGPMVEIHDASPQNEGVYALFGFIGIPPKARRDVDVLKQQILAQLGRLFGPKATEPMELLLKDWAFDPFTSSKDDLEPLLTHPKYGLPDTMRGIWDGNLIFAGTEVAPQFGGYLEGALEAAENTLIFLQNEKF